MRWAKKTLGELCFIEKGKIGIQKAIPGEYPLVVTAEKRLSHNEFHFEGHAVIIPLVSSSGHGHRSLKRIHYQTGKFAVGNILCAVIPKDKTILRADYLFRFLDLNKENELVSRMRGMANVSLPIKEIAKIEIPVPPIDAQIEFVKHYSDLEEKSNGLDDEIRKQLSLVKQLRQACLREAMQGKLTSDWREENPNFESASELLRKIKAEKEKLIEEGKLKKQKSLPPIKQDEIPFEIPEGWVWCRLGEIVYDQVYGTSSKADNTGDIPVLRMGNITTDGRILYSNLKYVSSNIKDLPSLFLENGDIAFNRTNSYELVGKCGVFENEKPYTLASYLIRVRLGQYSISKFYSNYINSSLCRETQIEPKIIQQNGQANFNGTKLSEIIVPAPPLSEQQRIVSKLDELMQYCNQLEETIKTSQEQNEMLLQQVLREALEPKEDYKEVELKVRKCNESERAILAGHIINQTNSEDFGRVKFQKLLYLVEHHCQIDLDSNYQRKVAGPYDGLLLKDVESTLERLRFYKIHQSAKSNHRVNYSSLSFSAELDSLFNETFADEGIDVDKFLRIFKTSTWEQCEIVATLYAVWNNRIIKKQPINDELLRQDFLKWDKNKRKYSERLDGALVWMKKNGICPSGWGKVIE